MALSQIPQSASYTNALKLLAVLLVIIIVLTLVLTRRHHHGTVGSIKAVNLPVITIDGQKLAERVIISSSTVISTQGMTPSQFQAGQRVVVIGRPDSQGDIHAEFIKIIQ